MGGERAEVGQLLVAPAQALELKIVASWPEPSPYAGLVLVAVFWFSGTHRSTTRLLLPLYLCGVTWLAKWLDFSFPFVPGLMIFVALVWAWFSSFRRSSFPMES